MNPQNTLMKKTGFFTIDKTGHYYSKLSKYNELFAAKCKWKL